LSAELEILSMEYQTVDQTVCSLLLQTSQAAADRHLSPAQIHQLLQARPTLAAHSCRQQGLGQFGEKIAQASLPHLLEHLIIDRLVTKSNGTLVAGVTRWQNQPQGRAQVRLRLPVSLLPAVENAVRQAAQELNDLLADRLC